MPDPKKLKIEDRIRYVSIPDEFLVPGRYYPEDDFLFVQTLIDRKGSCRIFEISKDGYPCFRAITQENDGTKVYHYYTVIEKTGWVKVKPRKKK